MVGLYIHIPFCKKKCPYCDFLSYVTTDSKKIKTILAAVERELGFWAKDPYVSSLIFSTLYIGGGTPSLVDKEDLKNIVKKAFQLFNWDQKVEFTIEANPESLTKDWLDALVDVGLTRISIGIQDLTEKGLKRLGRIHSLKQGLSAIEMAKGFRQLDISVDIIYNWPGQGIEDIKTTLSRLLFFKPHHISAYELNIEPKTTFYALYKKGKLKLQDEERSENIYKFLIKELKKHNYHRYEISNFSLKGHECKHNINYWENGIYLGIGPGAVSFLPPIRGKNPSGFKSYLQAINSAKIPFWIETEKLDKKARFRESVILALRMTKGFNINEMEQKWGFNALKYYNSTISRLISQKLLILENNRIFLSDKGIRLSNFVFRELV